MVTTTNLLTAEDLEQMSLPHSQFELIDGVLVEMSPSGGRASGSAMRIGTHLSNHVLPRGLGEVFGADGGFVLKRNPDMIRVPDVAFVRTDRLPPDEEFDGFLRLAPDIAVEVISPTDRMADVMAKVMLYLEVGVKLVWLVDPRQLTVTVYAADGSVRLLRDGETLDGGEVLPEFRLRVAEIFA